VDPGARDRGQDYRDAPVRPYYMAWGDPAREGASPLLEVPVTVVQPHGDVDASNYAELVKKVEELTLVNRGLTEQLAGLSSVKEQLTQQLTIKDTEKQVAVGEHSKRLQDALTAQAATQTELDSLRALKLQVEVATELGRPDLLKLASRLPAMTDKEALKTVMQDFASFADEAVRAREKQLLGGVTPAIGTGGGAGVAGPASKDAWESHINGLALGSPERKKAMNDYGDWLERQYNPQR